MGISYKLQQRRNNELTANNMKVFVIARLIAAAVAAPVADGDFTSSEEEIVIQPYQFSHDVADDDTTNYQTRVESQDEEGVVRGQYSYVGPNGVRYITTYTADAINGFQAQTQEEQTDIKIVFPSSEEE